jgi:tmRNA-binding protein
VGLAVPSQAPVRLQAGIALAEHDKRDSENERAWNREKGR